MSPIAVSLAILSQVFQVIGQVFIKHAMERSDHVHWTKTALRLIPGIVGLAIWFFLWVGLLESWDLKSIYPFQGLAPVLLVFAAMIFLQEKLTIPAWVGVVLITLGVVLVASR
jgi:uncharacterized membrane protein